MTERPPLLRPATRVALLRRVSALTADDLRALDAAVRALVERRSRRPVDRGFFFAWWEGPRPPVELEREIDALFGEVLAALAGGLTGLDVERMASRFTPKPGPLDSLANLFRRPRPALQVTDAAIALVEDAVAPMDPRLAVVATWNMACAVALRDRLPAEVVAALEAPWRRALGDPPAA